MGDRWKRAGSGDELRKEAALRLLAALGTAFGGACPRAAWQWIVARGTPGRVLVESADRVADVLVVGAAGRSRLRRALFLLVARSASRMRPARCSPSRPHPCTASCPWCDAGSSSGCRST
ncbi:universal stress protein [Streptomyces sp. NPDC002688]|uniref:universal stress protein n=1 Tax=Streptomyces sp. NPDC002688 TaxID=3154423 RepID=UPI00332E04B6